MKDVKMRDLRDVLREAQTLVIQEVADIGFIEDNLEALASKCDEYFSNQNISTDDFLTLGFIDINIARMRDVTATIKDILHREAQQVLKNLNNEMRELTRREMHELKMRELKGRQENIRGLKEQHKK